jgi:DNA-binding transcriptional LysR family regulator
MAHASNSPPIRLDLQDLRLLVAVAEAGVLSKAATRVHLSAAAASERLRHLEDRLGKTLFYRASDGLAPTLAGDSFLRHARIVLQQMARAQEDLAALDDESVGHLRIFANTSAVTEFMPGILGSFMSQRPQVTIDLVERPLRDVVRGVLDGSVDFGIIASNAAPADLQSLHFATDRMVVVAPPGHVLGEARPLHFEQTLAYAQVGLDEASSYGSFMREVTHPLPTGPHTRIQLRSFEALCRMVSAGVGVGVVPESAARRYQQGLPLVLYPLLDAWALRERRVVARDFAALPACGRLLIDAIRLAFRPE